jgi:Uma2 family endonuclease
MLSPSTRRLDAVRKRADDARFGVQELWLIDCEVPEAIVARQTARGEGTFADGGAVHADGVLRRPLLPDVAVRLGDLVARA